MTWFNFNWASCDWGTSKTYSGDWGSFDCKSTSTTSTSTTSYNGDTCLKLGSHGYQKVDLDYTCDLKDVSFNVYGVSLQDCGTKFKAILHDSAGNLIDAKYEWVNKFNPLPIIVVLKSNAN